MNLSALTVPVVLALVLFTPMVAEAKALEEPSRQWDRNVQSACLREARWPVTHSAAYTHGDIRTKRQLSNSSGSEVRGMQQVCRALASRSVTEKREAQALCREWLQLKRQRQGAEAQEHAERVSQVCETLNAPPGGTD